MGLSNPRADSSKNDGVRDEKAKLHPKPRIEDRASMKTDAHRGSDSQRPCDSSSSSYPTRDFVRKPPPTSRKSRIQVICFPDRLVK